MKTIIIIIFAIILSVSIVQDMNSLTELLLALKAFGLALVIIGIYHSFNKEFKKKDEVLGKTQ